MYVQTTRRTTLVILSLIALLFLAAACGGALSGKGQTESTATGYDPTATMAVTEENPTATATVVEENPMPTGTVAEVTILTEDDRPGRLRGATGSWNTNWHKHTIQYSELLSGGPPRDGIPSIDNPRFISPDEAAKWLADNEPVIVLEIEGDAHAYPLQILTWHEIVNDTVGDVPVIVTFCPLCNSAIIFDRRVDGEVYEFGTSGLLRNSDLVMYDRTTESLWQQFTGEAIVGDMVGAQLAFLPSTIISFADFRAVHPDGLVLSRETGYLKMIGHCGCRAPFSHLTVAPSSAIIAHQDADSEFPTVTYPSRSVASPGTGG